MTLNVIGSAVASQQPAARAGAARFEVTSIKAVHPTLVNTIAALQKKDAAGARACLSGLRFGWNGIEVYISARYPDAFKGIGGRLPGSDHEGLRAANPDTAALVTDAKAMLAKFDETGTTIEKAAPLTVCTTMWLG